MNTNAHALGITEVAEAHTGEALANTVSACSISQPT